MLSKCDVLVETLFKVSVASGHNEKAFQHAAI